MHKTALSLAALSFCLTSLALPAQSQEVTSSKSTGLILMDEDDYDALPERDPLMRGRLPQFVDLSSFFPPPGHQGAQGSCVGWAVGYALKTYQEALEFNISRPQAWDHFSPAFVFNSIKQGDDCSAGSRISDALEFVSNTGVVRMDDFPYEEGQCLPPAEDMSSIARDYTIKSYRRLQKDGMLFAIREALSNEKPVVVAMRVFPSFEDWDGGSNYRHDPDIEFQVDFHAVTVVGYDDERRALKIINSWGTEWGDDGFFWMDYRAARDLIAEAYVTTDRLFDEPFPDETAIVLASDSDTPRGNNAASGAPIEEEMDDAAPADPEPLDVNMLANAVTGHVGRNAEGQTPQGYDYYPASVWLNLEAPYLNQIASVRYYFYHRTFRNPMHPESDSNVFLASWHGYGCIENAEVKVVLKSGEELAAPFNLCTIWDRFHPAAFRKDGSRGGTAPLSENEDFDETSPD